MAIKRSAFDFLAHRACTFNVRATILCIPVVSNIRYSFDVSLASPDAGSAV